MITVMGAGGNTGRVAAEVLLGRGEKVRVVGRDAGKLAPLQARGAEVAVGDATAMRAAGQAAQLDQWVDMIEGRPHGLPGYAEALAVAVSARQV